MAEEQPEKKRPNPTAPKLQEPEVLRATFGTPIPPKRLRASVTFKDATWIFDVLPWPDCTICGGFGFAYSKDDEESACRCVLARIDRALGRKPKRQGKGISKTGGLDAARAARRRK